jgi:hypothetical protein
LSILFSLLLTIFDLLLDASRFTRLSLQPRCALAAENLFLISSGGSRSEKIRRVRDRSAIPLGLDKLGRGQNVEMK